jgi:hypothetical protein
MAGQHTDGSKVGTSMTLHKIQESKGRKYTNQQIDKQKHTTAKVCKNCLYNKDGWCGYYKMWCNKAFGGVGTNIPTRLEKVGTKGKGNKKKNVYKIIPQKQNLNIKKECDVFQMKEGS